MHVSQAQPAPKFINLPAPVVCAVLDNLGKGHLETLTRIALYLWGHQVPLEGTASEFESALGISIRTWQRHTPELGLSGGLKYRQPHHGFYVLAGFAENVALHSACAAEVAARVAEIPRAVRPKSHEIPGLIDDLYRKRLSDKTTKLSHPLVVVSSTDINNLEQKKQQHDHVLEGGVGGEAQSDKIDVFNQQNDKIDALPDFDPVLGAVSRLYEQEIGTLTLMLADELRDLTAECRDVERWREVFKASLGARNRWAWSRKAIREKWDLKSGPQAKKATNANIGNVDVYRQAARELS